MIPKELLAERFANLSLCVLQQFKGKKKEEEEDEKEEEDLTKTVQRKWSKWKDDSMCSAGQERGRTITIYSQL